MHTPFSPFVSVNVTGSIDRSEFWRDAEAAQRLWSPGMALRFLASLCRARATYELIAQSPRVVDALFEEQAHIGTLALWRECQARGLCIVPLRHIEARITTTEPYL